MLEALNETEFFLEELIIKYLTVNTVCLHSRNISASVTDDKWHHVCASWGAQPSGVLRIYIDGQIKLNESDSAAVFSTPAVTGTQFNDQ